MHELSTDWATLGPLQLTSTKTFLYPLLRIFHQGEKTGLLMRALFRFPAYLHWEQSDTLTAPLLECDNCTGREVWFVDGLSLLIQRLQDDERFLSQTRESLANTAALRRDTHFYSGQMSAFFALRIEDVAAKRSPCLLVGKEKGHRYLGVGVLS